jgi:enterochelin esterase-like enzyme
VGLDDPLTRWIAIGVAVVATVALVVGWRGLARRGFLAVLGRSVALLGVNVSVLTAVFLVVNAQFGLFSDWADLLGTQQVVTTTQASGSATAQASEAAPVRLDGYDGRVWRVQVPGPRSATTAEALVVLPTGYCTTPAPAGGYPVIEAFHGYPGTPEQWLDAMHLMPSMDAAVTAHQLAPSVVVIPTLEVPAGRDTECVDAGDGQPKLDTWLSQDVPDYVEKHYAVSRQPSSWATMGLSMGGWCANAMAMLHPDRFSAAVAFGGYSRLDLGSWRPFSANSPEAKRYDLVALAKQDPPAVRLWGLASKEDTLSWPSTQALASAVHGPTTMTLVTQQQGGHRTSIWAGIVPQALTWLGSAPGFAPAT